jgi:hypothetical protein
MTNMSTPAPKDTKEAKEAKTPSAQEAAQLHLGILEEDDEFEEFPVAGE